MRRREGNKEVKILQAAIKVFAEYGYHDSRISKIAEVAGVANGSIYLYYKSKEQLLFRMIESLWQNLTRQIERISEQNEANALQKAETMIDVVFDIFTSDPKLATVVILEHNQLRRKGVDAAIPQYEVLLDSFSRIYEQGVSEGLFDESVDPNTFLHFVFGGLYHIIHSWVKNPRKVPLPQSRESVKFIIRNGLIKHN